MYFVQLYFVCFLMGLHWIPMTQQTRWTTCTKYPNTPPIIYCDVPGSPCLSKNGSNVRSVLFKIFCRLGLVHLWMDQRIPGPVSCGCLKPGWFVGDPTSLARDNMMEHISLLVPLIHSTDGLPWYTLPTDWLNENGFLRKVKISGNQFTQLPLTCLLSQ